MQRTADEASGTCTLETNSAAALSAFLSYLPGSPTSAGAKASSATPISSASPRKRYEAGDETLRGPWRGVATAVGLPPPLSAPSMVRSCTSRQIKEDAACQGVECARLKKVSEVASGESVTQRERSRPTLPEVDSARSRRIRQHAAYYIQD